MLRKFRLEILPNVFHVLLLFFSLKDRKVSFSAAPGTSLFVHWMFGMVFVYYFAAFISLLREVLRPGVLWFLRNLNDPDFSPIQV